MEDKYFVGCIPAGNAEFGIDDEVDELEDLLTTAWSSAVAEIRMMIEFYDCNNRFIHWTYRRHENV